VWPGGNNRISTFRIQDLDLKTDRMRRLYSASHFSVFLVVERNFKVANFVLTTEGVGFQNLALFTTRVSKTGGFNSAAEGNYQGKSWFLRNSCTGFHNKYLELAHYPPGSNRVIENMGSAFASAAVLESNPLQSHWAR